MPAFEPTALSVRFVWRLSKSMQARMRIVVSGHEICGLIHDLAEELSRRGHTVVTVAMAHRFFPYTYDYDQYAFLVSYLTRRFGARTVWQRLFQILWELSRRSHKAVEIMLRRRLVSRAQLYIRVWGKIPFDREVLATLDRNRIRVATLLMGSDVRDYDVFRHEYGMTRWQVPPEYHEVRLREKLEVLRTHERYADAIFSVPDQMGLALRPYHHLQVPLQLDRFRYNVPGRAVPVVVHAPSVPHMKGSDVILDALETLSAEGVKFELLTVKDMPQPELLRVLADADVLVDELVLHGPGWLSFEAMASGCAVATHYLDDSPVCFRPPVWNIDESNISDRLRILLTDRQLRVRLAEEGRRYVEQNNRIEEVVDTLLEKVYSAGDAAPDYLPTYLTRHYVPRADEEAETINSANALVEGEPWYRAHVAGHSHDGLVF